MSLVLINISSGTTSDGRFLAELVELTHPEVQTHLVHHRLDPADHGGGRWRCALVTLVQGLKPRVVGICCSLRNAEQLPDLCEQLRGVLPDAALILGGSETRMLEDQRWRDHGVDHIIRGDPREPLLGWVEALCGGGPQRKMGPPASMIGSFPADRIVEEVVVEPDWGGETPLWLWRHGALEDHQTLYPGEAAARLEAFLELDRSVKLMVPHLTGQREGLMALLDHLSNGQPRRLHLEVLAEHLDRPLLSALSRAGVNRLSIEVSALMRGELPARTFPAVVQELAACSIEVSGDLVYGILGINHNDLMHSLDQCLGAGLDHLNLHCLRVPWSSGLCALAEAGRLRHSLSYPREVLYHQQASSEDLMRSRRLAATWELLAPPLAGTGLLRALSGVMGSAAEILDGFSEELLAQERDPLVRPPRRVARLFFHYLRKNYGVDLEQTKGGVKLRRAPLLALRWLTEGQRIITDDGTGRIAHVGDYALSILDRFDDAKTGREVCEDLLSKEPDERRRELRGQISQTLEKMVSMGFLVPQGDCEFAEEEDDEAPFTCLEEFDYHYRMLADTVRVDAYRRAINQVVRPGQHVIEVGTGTGILAVLAAQAGARVTTIERYSILGVARRVARQNGVEDRITFVRGRSDLVELEEKGDVLISEIVGNRILNEGLLETTLDVRRRLLHRDAQLIPSAIEILAEVGTTDRFEDLQREFGRLGSRYGVGLEPLMRWFQRQQRTGRVVWELGSQEKNFTPLAPELSVIRLDLATLKTVGFSRRHIVLPLQKGLANAVALAFNLELQPGIHLTTRGKNHDMHWNKPVFMLRSPMALEPGKPLHLAVQYEPQGEISLALES